jgi:hypothetical protein
MKFWYVDAADEEKLRPTSRSPHDKISMALQRNNPLFQFRTYLPGCASYYVYLSRLKNHSFSLQQTIFQKNIIFISIEENYIIMAF